MACRLRHGMLSLVVSVSCSNAGEDAMEGGDSSGTADGSTSTTSDDTTTTSADASSSTDPDDGMTTVPEPECGNGVVEPPEECDDANTDPGDGCDPDCTATTDTKQWEDKHAGDMGLEDIGQGIAVDSADNIIVVGYVSDEPGNPDIWIRKYAPDGTTLWTTTKDPSVGFDDRAYAVAVDSADDIFVVGDVGGDMSTSDIYLAKLDPDGGELWSTAIDGPSGGADVGLGVAVDGSDNVVLTGYVRVGTADNDIFVAKYDGNGTQLWTDQVGGPDNLDDRGEAVAIDADDNVVVAGHIANEGFNDDVWFRKYDASGTELWTVQHDSPMHGSEEAFAVAIVSDGSIAVAGTKPLTATNQNAWLGRYDGDGNLIWTRDYGAPSILHDRALGVAIDSQDAFVVVGYKGTGQNDTDIWIRKWDESANVVWTQTLMGAGGGNDEARAVAIDSQDNIVVTGYVRDSQSVDSDIWVAKYGP